MSTLIRVCLVAGILCSVAVAEDRDREERKKKKEEPIKTWSDDAKSIVKKMAKTVKRMKTYQDEGRVVTVDPFVEGSSKEIAKQQLIFSRPDLVRYESDEGSLMNNGKDVSVAIASMKRFRKRSLENGETSSSLMELMSFGSDLSVSRIYLSDKPLEAFAERLWGLEVDKRDRVGKEDCVLLTGIRGSSEDDGFPVRIWLRAKDGLIQKVEVDTTSQVRDEVDDTSYEDQINDQIDAMPDNPFFKQAMETALDNHVQEQERKLAKLQAGERKTMTFDAGRITLDKKIKKDLWVQKPPKGYKEVKWLYRFWKHFETTAIPLELSGKPIPAFTLVDVDDNEITDRQFEKKVGILFYDCVYRGQGQDGEGWQDREVRRELIDTVSFIKGLEKEHSEKVHVVSIVCEPAWAKNSWVTIPDMTGEDLELIQDKHQLAGTVVYDDENPLVDAVEPNASCVVLVLDGVVQGIYRVGGSTSWHQWLERDVDTLVEGKRLRAGKKLSSREIIEMRNQLNPMGVVADAGVDAEEYETAGQLVEAWSYPARQQFGFPRPGSSSSRYWLTSNRKAEYIGPRGDVIASVQIPREISDVANPYAGGFGSSHCFGFFGPGGQPASLLMEVPVDPNMGFFMNRPGQEEEEDEEEEAEKEVRLTLWDRHGEHLWTFAIDAVDESRGGMNEVMLHNVDGTAGDEICFVYGNVLYVLGQKGELLATESIPGYNTSVMIEDRDEDGVDEFYVKAGNRLVRYDYEEDDSSRRKRKGKR